ncbi:hypothetical protein CcaCcLH18_01958 [Colletotrichum camelliae]|nr:hypothetical protein CcaCcLH18_01958 [Colletotrichum camelliae]
MAKSQFRQLDVESMARLYGQKEPKQKATQLKRQYQRVEQRQQTPIPPSMLPSALELDFGTLITSETQPITHTSGNFCGVNGQGRTEVEWNQEPNDVARILCSMAPPFGIGPITETTMNRSSLDETASPPEFCLPHTPLLVQLPSEQDSREEPSLFHQELLLFPNLGKSSMAQIHPTSRLVSNMNTKSELDSAVGVSSLETANKDESSEDNSEDISGSDSGSDSESVGSDYGEIPGLLEERVKRRKRRHWTRLEELRLRAWIGEKQKWPWIVEQLKRSELGIKQHWAIMRKRDNKGRK